MQQNSHYLRDTLLTAIAPMLWGTTYILTTQVLPPDRPFTAAVIRVLPAGLILLAWARSMPPRGWWLKLGILAALNIGIFQALLFIAAYRLPGGLAAIFGALQPLITMALASLANRRSPGWRMISVALLGLPGMAMLLWAPGMQWDLTGVIAAFAGVCCVSAGAFLVRRWQPPMSVIALTGWQCALGGLMLLPLALLLEPALPALSLQQIAGYSYLSGFGALLAYVLWIRGIQKLPLAASSSLALLSPVVATILGWVILDQKLAAPALTGMAIVLLSVYLVQREAAKSIVPSNR
ncbi:EamA family transporter [Undibacterium luofuense]|uniref:EamA family transporter n=1 Tax=Undibacterium luofuense TaxID=2828733 RepID=A0A941I459_9BURK|nr:EamA family transporter [Undibacterium luofuense]MBR7781302.1 EamA family transporter [Undibacterium luofuense]